MIRTTMPKPHSALQALRGFGLALLAAAAVPASAADKWIEVRSPHFTVESDAGADKAKDVAKAFEEIRAVFQGGLRGLHVDPGQPMLIIASRNDDSLKTFLLDYAAAKNRAQLAGWFQPTQDTNYALLDAGSYDETDNAYHAIFHEYTHAIIRMNFGPIPTWLNEGLAEYYGNTVIKKDETDIGRPTDGQLYLLRTSPMIPVATLMTVDIHSPLYSEQNRSSMFYSESWALTHYLLSDQEALQAHLFQKYLAAMEGGADGLAAAQQAFGDLGAFEKKLGVYLRKQGFSFRRLKPMTALSDKDLAVRDLVPAEVMALQADFYARSGHLGEAATMAQSALALAPDLPAAHEAAGFVAYTRKDSAGAEKEFLKAAVPGGNDFRPPFYLADLLQQKHGQSQADYAAIAKRLEEALAINPGFAPAQSYLAFAYLDQPATRDKALEPALKAAQNNPADLAYLANLGQILQALGKNQEAALVSARLTKAARTPEEKAMAASFASTVAASGN